ncbi:Serine aminopeptidase S33 domain-containing protein [Plasmodiophora brassicae]|uniref:Serine aminopeptidase S33 domain-containing protein n=1 Tax=Plasmodiophora brassicae TaxID=37360 RepID=A0A0G4IQF0_PLABS|nr:hypothetical protein PBRA_000719 [Plasmodiophora brassicae]SPQ97684.1 unnamed protein product [Plasmodiophora brassicae]
MCNLLCCFGFLTCLGCRDRVARTLLFFPPETGYHMDFEGQTMCLINSKGEPTSPLHDPSVELKTLRVGKNKIATFFIRHPKSRFTILFSHGNATDLGYMRDHLVDMSSQLQVNLFAYDFCGYGESTGLPSVASLNAEIRVCFDHLTNELKIPRPSIVVYGQSLGTAPTVALASQAGDVAGVILHSPLLSALRVIRPVKKTHWFDILRNVDLIEQVKAPILIVHGDEDEEVPVLHAKTLHEMSHQRYPAWFVEGAGHNNIEVEYRGQYFDCLSKFLSFLESELACNKI